MTKNRNHDTGPSFAKSLRRLRDLHSLCREGRFYEVERWISDGRPLQLAPEAIRKGARPKTALQIALETGQHSLCLLLLRSGYRLELERYSVLDLILDAKRYDLFDLLLAWGADIRSADVYSVLDTYNTNLYERLRSAGYDLTQRHEMGSYLGHTTSNRPLLGFAKRHRKEDRKIQQELNIALGCHARAGSKKGISLCLWAGADPHVPAPCLEFGAEEEEDPEDEEDILVGWTAIEEAAGSGHLEILKRLGPDPNLDDFDSLYRFAKVRWITDYLLTIEPPQDITSILASQLLTIDDRVPMDSIMALLECGVVWGEEDRQRIADTRRSLLKLDDYDLKRILSRLKEPTISTPGTYAELTRTPRMQKRLRVLGLTRRHANLRSR